MSKHTAILTAGKPAKKQKTIFNYGKPGPVRNRFRDTKQTREAFEKRRVNIIKELGVLIQKMREKSGMPASGLLRWASSISSSLEKLGQRYPNLSSELNFLKSQTQALLQECGRKGATANDVLISANLKVLLAFFPDTSTLSSINELYEHNRWA